MYFSLLLHGECDNGRTFRPASNILFKYSDVFVQFLLDYSVPDIVMAACEFNVCVGVLRRTRTMGNNL